MLDFRLDKAQMKRAQSTAAILDKCERVLQVPRQQIPAKIAKMVNELKELRDGISRLSNN